MACPRARRGGESTHKDIGRCSSQLHPFALEAQVRDPRDVLVAVAKVVREEEGEALHLAELGPLHGEVLHLGGLRELELLLGGRVLGRLEVDVLPVLEDLERLGRAGRLRRADEDGVQLDLPGEARQYGGVSRPLLAFLSIYSLLSVWLGVVV